MSPSWPAKHYEIREYKRKREQYLDDEETPMTIEEIARVAHEVSAGYCRAIGDMSQTSWEDAPEWQKESVRNGVVLHIEHPETTPEDSHKSWLALKTADGWVWGPVKDPEKKQHPCIMSYWDLPNDQKMKDMLFSEVVRICLQRNEAEADA